jgi:hypothetical protein
VSHIKRLNLESRDVEYPNTRPVDAATLIILDTSAAVPKLLMGQRNANLAFIVQFR